MGKATYYQNDSFENTSELNIILPGFVCDDHNCEILNFAFSDHVVKGIWLANILPVICHGSHLILTTSWQLASM